MAAGVHKTTLMWIGLALYTVTLVWYGVFTALYIDAEIGLPVGVVLCLAATVVSMAGLRDAAPMRVLKVTSVVVFALTLVLRVFSDVVTMVDNHEGGGANIGGGFLILVSLLFIIVSMGIALAVSIVGHVLLREKERVHSG